MADGNMEFALGRHEQAIDQLLKNDERMLKALTSIERTLAEQRGARRSQGAIWGAAGGAVTALIAVGGKVVLAYITGKHG